MIVSAVLSGFLGWASVVRQDSGTFPEADLASAMYGEMAGSRGSAQPLCPPLHPG